MVKNSLSYIRILVSEDKLEEAIEFLSKTVLNNELLDDIIIQSAEYHNLRKQETSGTIDNNELSIGFNKIRRNILTLVRELDQELPNTETKFTLKSYKNDFISSLIKVEVIKVLLSKRGELTIKSILDYSSLNKEKRKLIVEYLRKLESIGVVRKKRENEKTLWFIDNENASFFEECF